jgi:hypothetical protein
MPAMERSRARRPDREESAPEELYERAGEPGKLVMVPGGAHTTVQHDPELQSMALRWLERELDAREASR